jgi:hypothetical protein
MRYLFCTETAELMQPDETIFKQSFCGLCAFPIAVIEVTEHESLEHAPLALQCLVLCPK